MMQSPLTLYPKTSPGKRVCNLIHDGKRYLIYPKYKSCVIYMIRDDLTFAFMQVLKPISNQSGARDYPITDVAVHEGIGIIGVVLQNEVICHAPSLVKYSVKDGTSEDTFKKTVWVRFACLSLEDNISCISWKPGIHSESISGSEGGIRMIMLATATSELTFWECTLSEEASVDVGSPNLSSMNSILRFRKRYSTKVSNVVTMLAYSNDGFFLAEVCVNSSFVKVWYEYDQRVFLDFGKSKDSPESSSGIIIPSAKRRISCGFGYLPHPGCVYNVSWKPNTIQGSTREVQKPDISSSIVLTNCHDGVARIWMPIHDNGIFKFCLIGFIQSNLIESKISTNYEVNSPSGFNLASIAKRKKERDVIYSPVVWLPLCTNVRDYRDSKGIGASSTKRDGNYHTATHQKQSNASLSDLSSSPHKHPPFYNFIDLGKKQLDTGHPILFQVKKDATILFCKLEGTDAKNNLYSHKSNSRCMLSCLKPTSSGSKSSSGYVGYMNDMNAVSKSLRPRVIMCALNSPCKEFIQFFSSGFVMPHIYVNPEPQIIEYNNIVLLEKALLIGVKNDGYIQAFTLFIKPREESLWVIPRIVPLQSFHASCDPIVNIWPHNNVDIPLHITNSYLYNNPSYPEYTVHTLSVYYGPLSSNTSLISVIKIRAPIDNRGGNAKLKDDVKIEWIQTSPTFIVWGLAKLRPMVYTVDISNNSPPRNSSPVVHRSYSRVFGSDSTGRSMADYGIPKTRTHVGFNSNTYYTLESGVTFMGYIPVEFSNEDTNCDELDKEQPKLIMLKSFDSSSHGNGASSKTMNTSLYFVSAILAMFENGLYNLWHLTFEGNLEFNQVLSTKDYIPDLPPGRTIKIAEHLFSPCEFFQLSLTVGYHFFSVVVEGDNNRDTIILYKYGTLGSNRLSECFNIEDVRMSSMGSTESDHEILIIKGDMLEFSCTAGQLKNGEYCLCIWIISEEGMYRKLVHYETFKEKIVSVDWLVLPSSQMILAVAQKHRVMIYSKLNRAINSGNNMWTRLSPFTASCSEEIFAVKWLRPDGYKLAVITEEMVFFLEDYVDNWNLPTAGNPLQEAQSRMHLSFFSEVDALEEQSYNFNPYMLYHYMLLGNFDYVGYIFRMLYLVLKNAPQYIEDFQRICLLWIFQKKMASYNESMTESLGASNDNLWNSNVRDAKDYDSSFYVPKDINKLQFENDEVEFIREYIEMNKIGKLGRIDALHLLYCAQTYVECKNLIHEFGMNSLRYIISMLMYKKCNDHKYTTGASVYIWAFFSRSRNNLLEWVKNFYGGKLNWKMAREAGIGWWAGDRATACEITELIARTEYVGLDDQNKNDPSRCMLFYSILGKKGVLCKMWHIAKSHPESHIMQTFLTLDLSVPKNRTIIQKNAFGLLSKGRFMDAATLFILIGKIHEATKICAKKMNDVELALLIYRVYDGEDTVANNKIIQQVLLPMAVEQGNRWKTCMLFYIIKEYEKAILSIVVPLTQLLEDYNEEHKDICCIRNNNWYDKKRPFDEMQHELFLDPLVYTLYRGLVAYRPLFKESSRDLMSKYLPGFILQSASRYEGIGMYDVSFTLARHIVYENSRLLYIPEYTLKGVDGGLENTLIATNSMGRRLSDEGYIPKCESDIRLGQFWDILATDHNKEIITGPPTVSSLAKLALWKLALKFIKEFCVSMDTVSTKLVDPFFSDILEDYTKIYIHHLGKIIKLIGMPYTLVSRTVILLCRNLDITGVFPILQMFIERSKFLDDITAEKPLNTNVDDFDKALFDEFTSLVFTSCYRQIWLLMNAQGLKLYGNCDDFKISEGGFINTYMQRVSILKAGAIARQTLLSIVMCKNAYIGVDQSIDPGCAHFEAPNMLESNMIVGNALFNYATLVKLFFTIFFSLLEESMVDKHDVLLELVEVIPDIFAIVYKIYSLKSTNYDDSTGALFSEAEKILTSMFLGRDNNQSINSEIESIPDLDYNYISECGIQHNKDIALCTEEIEDLAQRFLKISVLCYVISELDRFLGLLMTEMENPLDDDTYWFILELISRPLNRILCDLQLDYAYVHATRFELKLECIGKLLKSKKLKALWDFMSKVEDLTYIYEIIRGLSNHFNIISYAPNHPETLDSINPQSRPSHEISITMPSKSSLYIACSHRLVHFHDGNLGCFAINQANNDVVAVASNGVVDEISISEISCIMKTACSLSSANPLKRFAKRLDLSIHSIGSRNSDKAISSVLKDYSSQSFVDGHKGGSKPSLEGRSVSSLALSRVSSTFRSPSYKISDSYASKSSHIRASDITSLDSHPTLGYYIQSSSEPEVLSSNKDKINLRNHLLRTNTAGHGAGDHSSYVQLAHFGKQKPLVRLAANCSYITKCKFDNSGARFGAVGFPEKAIIWKFDAYIQSMDPLVDYRVKITSPKDLLFIESSSIVSIAGDFGSNDNNAVICDFLLPKTRCVVKEFKTPNDSINCIAYYPKNKLMLAGGKKGNIYVYDIRSHDPLTVLNSEVENSILSLCVEGRVGCLLAGGSNGTIEVWDINEMKLKDTWKMACTTALRNRSQGKKGRLNLTKEYHTCSIIDIKAARQSGDILACSNHGHLWKCRFY